ncbi:MAG: zf-HC2 domain-containing protein, partial [Candidatus Hydrogenedentes bacterium]|nr:zf-HC2 domain-containing protein [Candidatus Hydrogenedentota bacterium]
MTTCTNMQELMQAYVDGQLSTEDRIFVEKHVSECPECAHSFQEMQDLTSYLVDTFAAARISTTFVDRVSARLPDIYDEAGTKEIRELNKLAKQEGWFHRAGKFVPYAATAILGVALVILMA